MTTTRVSTASDGTQGNSNSTTAPAGTSISADGRYVVFTSTANNLVTGDTNGQQDVFLKDVLTGTVTLVSTASDGTLGNGASSNASISGDGSRIAFSSTANNLVAGDTNGTSDVFVKDLRTGATTRVSTDSSGAQATSSTAFNSFAAAISADGTHVAFASSASNLVAGDTNNAQDVFVKDLRNGITTRVSTNSSNAQATGPNSFNSSGPSISADGTRIAFTSSASNLVPGDSNGAQDVFVKDLSTGFTTRVSTDSRGSQTTSGLSSDPSISADGTRVAFSSSSSSLVTGDTNRDDDVFVKDLRTGTTTRVSTSSTGGQAEDGGSTTPSISADGTRVAFRSLASNLVGDPPIINNNVYVKNLNDGSIVLSSVTGDGTEGNRTSNLPSISSDGTRVAFHSSATNLVAGDTNGAADVFLSDVVCYAAGTAIRVKRGDVEANVAVEDLVIGDLAMTSSGEARPVRWLGHRTLDFTRHPEPRMVRPVRIAGDAFGEGRPARDLLVSPAHSICVDLLGEVLIPARQLINGTTITQEAVERVTYWHIELDAHDILIAEGLPAESYLDMGNRRFFIEADTVDLTLGPDAWPDRSTADFCRPFHEAGPLVDFVRDRLREQAEASGWTLVDSPLADMHLVADGVVIRPDVDGLTARFVLPADAHKVHLVSNVSIPAHVEAGSTDQRRLGLPLSSLTIDDGLMEARNITLDDARLGEGFHRVEQNAAGVLWRWTDGSALLPDALWAGCRGTLFLRMTLTKSGLPRWVGPRERSSAIDFDTVRQSA